MKTQLIVLVGAFCLAFIAAASITRPAPAAPPKAADTYPAAYIYFPHIAHEFCGPYLDPFDTSAAGWFTGETGGLRAEITGGEYRLTFTGRGSVWFVPGPVCARAAYRAAVDARWVGRPGNFIGLLFAIDDPAERAYLFAVNTDERLWLVFELRGDDLETVIAPTGHDAVLPGNARNRLAAERSADTIVLSVNGTPVGELRGDQAGDPVLAGVAAASYTNQSAADARFDNFLYTP